MTQEDALSAEYLLLTTLVYKVAAAAILATMLVRFGQFRRILLTEKRAWRERLTFAFAFGIPVMIGVIARLALGYDGADLSLAGAFLAGLIAGPYAGAIVGCLVGLPALVSEEWIAILLAVGAGFAGGGRDAVADLRTAPLGDLRRLLAGGAGPSAGGACGQQLHCKRDDHGRPGPHDDRGGQPGCGRGRNQ